MNPREINRCLRTVTAYLEAANAQGVTSIHFEVDQEYSAVTVIAGRPLGTANDEIGSWSLQDPGSAWEMMRLTIEAIVQAPKVKAGLTRCRIAHPEFTAILAGPYDEWVDLDA